MNKQRKGNVQKLGCFFLRFAGWDCWAAEWTNGWTGWRSGGDGWRGARAWVWRPSWTSRGRRRGANEGGLKGLCVGRGITYGLSNSPNIEMSRVLSPNFDWGSGDAWGERIAPDIETEEGNSRKDSKNKKNRIMRCVHHALVVPSKCLNDTVLYF